MSYASERVSIETWATTELSSYTLGFDRQAFTPDTNSIRMTINSGEALQRSFGNPGSNLVEHVGVLQMEVYTAGGAGSVAARAAVDDIQDAFLNKQIASDGTEFSGGSEDGLIVFSKYGQAPYPAGAREEAPFYVVTVNAPFVRYEAKA